MPSIKLTDQFGLDLDAQPAAASALLKYAQQIPKLRLDNLDLSKVGGLTLDEPAVKSLSSGVSFQNPVSLGDGAPAFSVAAGAHASLRVIDAGELPGEDDGDESGDCCYVAFEIRANASVSVSAGAGNVSFGVTPATEVEFASYSRFARHQGVTLANAVRQTVAEFRIPLKCDDLAGLPAGQAVRAGVNGTLSLSGSANLLAVTNPLAAATLPAPLPAVSVSAGGSITAGVSCRIHAGFDVIAHKRNNGTMRLGWYRKSGVEVSASVTGSEGISAAIGGTDIFSRLIGVISGDPKADLAELSSAGLSPEQAGAICGAVGAAVNRKLEIAVAAAITASDSHSATFLYDIDPAGLNPDSRAAVDRALLGDLSGLHVSGLAGVSPVRSIWDHVCRQGVELNVNLLGILNYRSIASLTLDGSVLVEAGTGSLVITDKATAERIQTTAVNFGADAQKLRHVLAESFLITAAYRSGKQAESAAGLTARHDFFELQDSTSRGDMAEKLRSGQALGLLSDSEAAVPAGASNFGRTLFTLSATYDDTLLERMFLDAGGTPLPVVAYETAGRVAIQALVKAGDVDEARLRPATDDSLWKRMKEVGQPGIGNLLMGVPQALIGAITADYSTIRWWADAMAATGQKLAEVRLWLARNPAGSFDSPEFQKLREALADHLRGVAKNTREEFGQPWGLIAMHNVAGAGAPAKLTLLGPLLVLQKQRQLAAADSA